MSAASSAKGPQVYENWLAFRRKEDVRGVSEYPLYSDARVTGQETIRPYMFFNPVALDEHPGYFRPIIYTRIEYYLDFEIPNMSKTDTSAFHGGTFVDEIAALVSLALGIRVRAGGMSRVFREKGDEKGSPVGWIRQPQFLYIDHQRPVVPNAIGERALSLLSPLHSIPLMSPEDANALVKAARSYQKALLFAEDDPSMSWLLFVGAIEKAALHWKVEGADKVDVLKELKPTLCSRFDSYDKREEILEIIAEEIYNLLGSTKKFAEFMLSYLPDPPSLRPHVSAQAKWETEALRKSFLTIYEHRSKALHEATPFPQPICDPLWREKREPRAWYEKPFAQAHATPGGTWVAKDLPMYLNTFEYIVRKVLLKWWSELKAK